ncbi:MAG: hypothetical protein Q8M98_09145 [Candidatus Cloacimonadaceae bacterium]|nr:hypothetical protein [Candidatus Cloacimonadaceae bacterium]MDP3114930.1 hypothetical protein [Candidatus Cloacimonadaceae bacterium]
MKKLLMTLSMTAFLCVLAAQSFNWYSQSDTRWKQNTLGTSRSSIGKSGCVLSCLSMLLNAEASNPRVTPDKLNTWLRGNSGFARGNLMRWEVPGDIDGKGLGLELVSQISKANDWEYLSNELTKGNKVIVKVAGRRNHWVLVIRQEGAANSPASYVINDPGMKEYERRTLAHFGGFRAARSYSGNWLDEDAFNLTSEIYVSPIETYETFLYELINQPSPADVYVTLKNNLSVEISGYFILGLFDKDDNLLRAIDYEQASILAQASIDLLYEMPDYTSLNEEGADLRIIYSKHFSSMPSKNEILALPSTGLLNYTNDSTH